MIGIFLLSCVFVSKVRLYDNIAVNRNAQQQYPHSMVKWGADRAVDGQKSDLSAGGGQCTLSQDGRKTAKWWVDLGGVLSIHYITIYYRTDNLLWDSNNPYTPRFLGFSVYISNTTNTDDGDLCFKDTMYNRATIPNPINITCAKHGRYIIYYNERNFTSPAEYSTNAFNELCEFEVSGCPTPGVYGENCDIPCPQKCQERHCDIVTGTCLGCIPGYKRSSCDQPCDNNKYGLECKQNCGNCSDGVQCNHVNGSCPNQCDFGARGNKCDEECPYGWHGKNCAKQCNPNCRGCNRFNGRCEPGCLPGWKGTFCEKECYGRMYGENCTQPCGQCRDLEQCHHINGTCLNGCNRGYQGGKCTEECPEGRYGYNCQDRCNINCGIPERCDRVTGQCQNGCQAGWKNKKCDSKCDGKTFGLGCTQVCGVCLGNEQCHHVNGTCRNGCDRGYGGISCIQECPSGRYGDNCAIACYPNCRGCNRFNGRCESGCFPGWKGIFCEKECDGRLYGENCTQPCGECRNLEPCHHINGTCLNGCNRGYKGGKCTEECLEGWFGYNCEKRCNIQCDSVTGLLIGQSSDSSSNSQLYPALYGLVAGFCVSVVLNIYFIVRYLRDKKHQPNNQQKKMKEQLSTEGDARSTIIFDNKDDAGGYQELGELGQQSHYDQLK